MATDATVEKAQRYKRIAVLCDFAILLLIVAALFLSVLPGSLIAVKALLMSCMPFFVVGGNCDLKARELRRDR